MNLRLLSWNVNGLRALLTKPAWSWFKDNQADLIALQEVRAEPEQLPENIVRPADRQAYFAPCQIKKGYSGVAVFTRSQPLFVEAELPDSQFRGEGRLLHLEFPHFHFFNGYFPNGGAEILDAYGRPTGRFVRVPYKMSFFQSFLKFAERCRKTKPVIVCGDFNIAHKAIDLANPTKNENKTGFLPEERAFLDRFTELGYVDTFRLIHGDAPGHYSWWSYRQHAREKNVGWRIDYFFVSQELAPAVSDAWIEKDVTGSDHCPVGLELSSKQF